MRGSLIRQRGMGVLWVIVILLEAFFDQSAKWQGLLCVMLTFVRTIWQRLWRRRLRQIEDLEDRAVKGDEIFGDQSVSGLDILIELQFKERADRIVAVKGKPVAI